MAFDNPVCSNAWRAVLHAPRRVDTPRSSRSPTPSRRNALWRPRFLCQRSQKHFRMCRRIQPSSRKTFRCSWASRYYPHQPTTYRRHSSRNSRLVTLRQLRQISRTFCLHRSTLCGVTARLLRTAAHDDKLGLGARRTGMPVRRGMVRPSNSLLYHSGIRPGRRRYATTASARSTRSKKYRGQGLRPWTP